MNKYWYALMRIEKAREMGALKYAKRNWIATRNGIAKQFRTVREALEYLFKQLRPKGMDSSHPLPFYDTPKACPFDGPMQLFLPLRAFGGRILPIALDAAYGP
jgi:hypothetical protein